MDYNEFNYQLEQLKSKIYKILEQSKLPIGAIFYLFKDIYTNLNNQYIATINSYSMNRPIEQGTSQVQQTEKNNQVE